MLIYSSIKEQFIPYMELEVLAVPLRMNPPIPPLYYVLSPPCAAKDYGREVEDSGPGGARL